MGRTRSFGPYGSIIRDVRSLPTERGNPRRRRSVVSGPIRRPIGSRAFPPAHRPSCAGTDLARLLDGVILRESSFPRENGETDLRARPEGRAHVRTRDPANRKIPKNFGALVISGVDDRFGRVRFRNAYDSRYSSAETFPSPQRSRVGKKTFRQRSTR